MTTGSICIMMLQEEQKERKVSARGTWVLVALLERACQAMLSLLSYPSGGLHQWKVKAAKSCERPLTSLPEIGAGPCECTRRLQESLGDF